MIQSDSFARFCVTISVALTVLHSTGLAASAQENLNIVGDLGTIIGSSEACGYALNEDAVATYIAENVPGTDLGFADLLRTNISYKRRLASEMTGLDQRVFCEAAQRSAESLGFVATD